MRRPSARVLGNRVDVHVAATGIDDERAPEFAFPDPPAYPDEPCTVQYTETGQDPANPEGADRLTVVNLYRVMFGRDLRLKPRDKLVWTDVDPPRKLFVEASSPSEAGRGAAFVVHCVEKL